MVNWIQAAIVAAVTALACFGLHSLDIDRLEAKQKTELTAQAKMLTDQCSKNKQITQDISHEYQNQLAVLNSQLDGLRAKAAAVCVPVTPTTAGHRSSAGKPKPVRESAVYDLAGEGEKYRLQLKACQDFVTKTWKENGQ